MTVYVWSAAGGGDLSASASWGGTDPTTFTSSDDLLFPDNVAQAVTSNLTALKDVDVNSINIFGFNADIGSSGNPMQIAAARVLHRGGPACTLYYDDSSAEVGNSASETGLIIVDSDNQTDAAEISGDEIDVVVALRGKTTLSSSGSYTLEKLLVHFRNNAADDATVVVSSGVGTITLAKIVGGLVTCDAAITTLIASGGRWTQDTAGITTLHNEGANVIYNASSTITDLLANSGTTDFSQTSKAATVTNAWLLPGAIVLANEDVTTFSQQYAIGSGKITDVKGGGITFG